MVDTRQGFNLVALKGEYWHIVKWIGIAFFITVTRVCAYGSSTHECAGASTPGIAEVSKNSKFIFDGLAGSEFKFVPSTTRTFPNQARDIKAEFAKDSDLSKLYLRLGFRFIDGRTLDAKKTSLYEKMGWKLDDMHFVGSTMRELGPLVKQEYERLNVPEEYQLVPSWIFGSNKWVNGKQKLNWFNLPWSEPLNRDISQIYDRNIPGRLFADSIANGFLPIYAGNTHDLGHMISFLAHPEYGRAMIDAFRLHAQSGLSRTRNHRLFYLFEMLELPAPDKKAELREFLLYKDFTDQPTSLDQVRGFYSRLTQETVYEHGLRLAEKFDQFLVSYGGAQNQIPERMLFFGSAVETRTEGVRGVFTSDLTQRPRHYDKGTVPEEGLHLMGLQLKVLLSFKGRTSEQEVREHFGGRTLTPQELDQFTRDFMARMEYALWEGMSLDPVQVIRDLVTVEPRNDSPYINYMRTVRGSYSRTYNMLVGHEEFLRQQTLDSE